MKNNVKKWLPLLVLICVFMLPVFLSYYLYMHHDKFHFSTTNKGHLISPAVELVSSDITKQPKWHLMYATDNCSQATEQTLYLMHQLHTALGKNQDRVDLLVWIDDECSMQQLFDFKKINLVPKDQDTFRTGVKTVSYKNKIYLIDPHSNLFMFYGSDIDMRDILKDVKKVLEGSQIG